MLHGKEEGINGASSSAVDLVGDHAERFNGGLPVRALVGPIIGKVTSTSAVVLLEVDGQAVISCILVDVLSGEEHNYLRLCQQDALTRSTFACCDRNESTLSPFRALKIKRSNRNAHHFSCRRRGFRARDLHSPYV